MANRLTHAHRVTISQTLPFQGEYPFSAVTDARRRYERARGIYLRRAMTARLCLAACDAFDGYRWGYFTADLVASRRYLANLRAARITLKSAEMAGLEA